MFQRDNILGQVKQGLLELSWCLVLISLEKYNFTLQLRLETFYFLLAL